MSNLTEKQEKFIEEYIKDGNATQAAIRAGYSERTAYRAGYNNVKNGQIKKRIESRRKELKEQLQKQFVADAVEARKVLFDIMKNDKANEGVRVKAAVDFLDRAGFKPTEKQNIEHSGEVTNKNIDMSDLTTEELKNLARLGSQNGDSESS